MSGSGNFKISREDSPCYEQVWGTPRESLWDDLIETHHYLGSRNMSGHRLKYLAWHKGEVVGSLSWSACANRLRVRDCYVGWDPEQLRTHRHRVLNNSRFLILPWVQRKNLASCVLAGNVRILADDWEQHFGYVRGYWRPLSMGKGSQARSTRRVIGSISDRLQVLARVRIFIFTGTSRRFYFMN